MPILSAQWDFRLLWICLSIIAKLYIICLLVSFTYSVYSLTCTTVRIRQIANRKDSDMGLLTTMTASVRTLGEFHTMLLLLFGLCCANELFNTLRAIQNSAVSLSAATWNIFGPVIAFAFFVFAALLFLHIFRWAVAHRLQSKVQ
jgi:hypothetical protein